jgi:hypothetical protein
VPRDGAVVLIRSTGLARRVVTDFAELAAERLLFGDHEPALEAMQQADNPADDNAAFLPSWTS